MESVGQKLRDGRLRLALTLEQVSADTRITLKNLRAIEADELSGISSRFFYRSFVRQFAARVSVDYQSIAGSVEQAASTMPEPVLPGQDDKKPIHACAFKEPRHVNLNWVRSVVSFCIVLTACSGMYGMWQNSHSNWRRFLSELDSGLTQIKATVSSVASPAKPVQPAETKQSVTRRTAATEETPARAVQVSQPELHVQLSAIERSWLSMIADGKEVFSGILDPSDTKILEGRESARIRTGNAGGLVITFNGKEIGVLGPHGQVRTVVFTKDNYEVLPSARQFAGLAAAFIQNGE